MGEAVKKRKVVSFSAKVKSSHTPVEEPSVNDHLLQAVITASKHDAQFKMKLMNAMQELEEMV